MLPSPFPHCTQLARYLALSGRALTAHDLYMLGLVTHIVENEAHHSLGVCLGNTMPPE